MAAVARLAAALLLSLRGSICLYQGEELGLPEADIAFEDLMDPAGKAFWPEYKGRDGCRTPFPWDGTIANAGFGSGTPWLPVSPVHAKLGVAQQKGNAATVLEFYRRAIAVRKGSPVMLSGDIEIEQADETVLRLLRRKGNEEISCLFNFSDRPTAIAAGEGEILLSDGASTPAQLAPLGFVWVRQG